MMPIIISPVIILSAIRHLFPRARGRRRFQPLGFAFTLTASSKTFHRRGAPATTRFEKAKSRHFGADDARSFRLSIICR